jgi:cell division septation protein DedD
LKRTPNSIDKEELARNLSWRRCNSFTRESILTYAPPSSGVYGLVNFNRQIFIGESENIRQALLRHESETDFQSQRLKPTGFTFELCAAGVRKLWAAELIKEFQPLLQKEAALTEPRSPSNGHMLSETDQDGWTLGTDAGHQEFPVHESEERPKLRRSFQIKRTQAVGLVSIFVAVIILYLGLPADYAVQKRANSMNPASSQAAIILKPQNASSTKPADRPVDEKPVAGAPNLNLYGSPSAKTGAAIQPNLESGKIAAVAHSAASAGLGKKWSVQISAAPAKNVADKLVQQLKAKGYDGYVVEVNVRGQTYYRVRVGRFSKREEAESMRQSLALHEGYEKAFLAGD